MDDEPLVKKRPPVRTAAALGLAVGLAAIATVLTLGLPHLRSPTYPGPKLSPDKHLGRYFPEPPGVWPILWPTREPAAAQAPLWIPEGCGGGIRQETVDPSAVF